MGRTMPAFATGTSKEKRMHIRMDVSAKRKLEKAAAYKHKSLSEFVILQALESAEKVIREHESLAFSQSDWDVFMTALETPPNLNKKLKEAFRLHHKTVVGA